MCLRSLAGVLEKGTTTAYEYGSGIFDGVGRPPTLT